MNPSINGIEFHADINRSVGFIPSVVVALFGLLVDSDLNGISLKVGIVERLNGLVGIFELGKPHGSHSALLEDVRPLDLTALLEVILEVLPVAVGRQISHKQLGAGHEIRSAFVRSTASVAASLEGLAVSSANSRHIDGNELVGVLGIRRRFKLDLGALRQGLEAIGGFLLDVGVMDQEILADFGLLSLGGDESDSAVVQPFGDDASLSLTCAHCYVVVGFGCWIWDVI